MSVGHMAMVFAAEGLDGPEKLLLLAYTNYTDPHGFCWPSEARLADDCGTSVRTVQRVKTRLVKKKLLKSVRRKNKSGSPISNLSRINLPKLASMARKRDQYDDDLISSITFDDDDQGDPEATLRGTPDEPVPASDLLTRHDGGYLPPSCQVPPAKMAGTYRQDGGQSLSDPLSDPSENSLSPVVAKAEDARGRASEREKLAAPTDEPTTALPSQRGGQAAQQPQEAPQTPATTAERVVRKAAILQPDEEAAFIQWATTTHNPRTPAWWRTVAKQGDLPDLVAAWRTQTAQAAPRPAAAVVLPTWCGQCDGEEVTRRWREDDNGRAYRCPACHPDAVPAPVVSRQQQEVDAQFERQMARARARDEAAGRPLPGTDTKCAGHAALTAQLRAIEDSSGGTSW